MFRRLFFALPLAALAQPGAAQTDPNLPPPDAAPPREPRRPPAEGRPRQKMSARRYDDLSPAQKRRAQRAVARDGERDVPPEEARRRWDATPERQRRASVRRVAKAEGGSRAKRDGAMRQPRDGAAPREGRMREGRPPEAGEPGQAPAIR